MVISKNVLNIIENMNLIELSNLISDIEKKYNLSNFSNFEKKDKLQEQEKEKDIKVSLYLEDLGKNKVAIIKIIKEVNNLSLKETKDLVESFPVLIKDNIDENLANDLKNKLEAVGAKINIKKNV